MLKFIEELRRRHHQRRALKRLESYDDHLLADVGLTRADLRALRYGRAA